MITSWHEVPFLRPFLLLALSIIFFDYISIDSIVLIPLFFGLVVIQFLFFHKKIFLFQQGVVLISLIVVLAGIRVNYKKEINPSNFSYNLDTTEYYYEIQVLEEPKKGKRYRAISEVRSIGKEISTMNSCNGKMLVYFPEDMVDTPMINQIYLALSRIQPVVNNTNPYAFDWKSYLYNRGVSNQVFLKPHQLHFIKEGNSNSIMAFAKKARTTFQNIIAKYIKDEDQQGIAFAMILGYKNKLNEDLYDAYTDTGAVHTLAVSGLHVGIMASILGFIFGFLDTSKNIQRIIKALILITGIWFYALITGAAPAITRAAIMFSIMIFDFYWSGNKNMINSLGAAGFIMLLIDPYNIYQAGFQFSFLALGGILIFYPVINKSIPYIPNKLLRYCWGLVAVSIAAQIAVFPITIFYFHKFPSYFWLSGIVAIPLAFIILSLGVSLIIIEYVFPYLSTFLGDLLSAFIQLLNSSISSIRELPYSSNDDLWLGNIEIAIIYLAIFVFALRVATNKRISFVLLFMLTTLYFSLHIKSIDRRNHQLQMMVYDIYGGTVVDFIDGCQVMSYSKIPRKDDSEKFMCHNYRMSIGMEEQIGFDLNERWQSKRLFHDSGFIMSEEKTVLIAYDEMDQKTTRDLDFMIITNEFTANPYEILEYHQPRTVILDKSMGWDRFYKWKRILNYKKIKTINLFNEGATIIKL